jgi:hypothetical protein
MEKYPLDEPRSRNREVAVGGEIASTYLRVLSLVTHNSGPSDEKIPCQPMSRGFSPLSTRFNRELPRRSVHDQTDRRTPNAG